MVTLLESDVKTNDRRSSKGNQLKWEKEGYWYKADYTGYEGLAEYTVSRLLQYSSLETERYILYETEEMRYKSQKYRGCRSRNFLPDGWQMLTLERLFHNFCGRSLYESIFQIQGIEERMTFLVEQAVRMTGLREFGPYLCDLFAVDALFLNEDRHMHNIAVLQDETGGYHYCPIFDNGAALLADTAMDYPMGEDIYGLIETVSAKTVCRDFEEQLEVAESLYGSRLRFSYDFEAVEKILGEEPYYDAREKMRVRDILMEQRRKYEYLFLQK
ncbi:MAG: hypothetical protein Q4C60_03955 [Eubacteriales bacterium]|nr:hypothetical protein [Eubacteriales bacterium]